MHTLRQRFGVSERKACAVVGQHRSTQRLAIPAPPDDEEALRAFLRAFSKERPRWGWRRAAKALRREGRHVNNKRIQRLWREEGLRVPYRKRKKPLRGIGARVGAMSLIAPNALWALDFQFDTTEDNRTIKLLNVIDEFTRECPAIVVERSIDADRVVTTLDRLVVERGAPSFVRFDNGPEFIAHTVADWCGFNGVARSSSTPVRHGRTPGSSPSTAESTTTSTNHTRPTVTSGPASSPRRGSTDTNQCPHKELDHSSGHAQWRERSVPICPAQLWSRSSMSGSR